MLVVHLVSAGAWGGIDVVIAILVFTALFTDDAQTASVSYQALELFAIWPLLVTGLVCLANGVTLGLGTKYGLARYWWVAVKLVINIVFVALVPLSLRSSVTTGADYGRQLTPGEPMVFAVTELIFPPIVSPLGLLIAVLLAVYKPWGRIRKGGRRRRHRQLPGHPTGDRDPRGHGARPIAAAGLFATAAVVAATLINVGQPEGRA